MSPLSFLLNLAWIIFGGLWMAAGWVIAAIIMAITIIGIPVAKQALKLSGYALWPFGRTLLPGETRHKGLSALGNVLWFVLVGW
jgi:uncharacterized membrane protein YccF (DUF307 family)